MYEHNALGYWLGLTLYLTKVRSSRARCPATALICDPLTLQIFTSKLLRSLVSSASLIAASVKPCIVIVIDILFKHSP